MHAIKVLGILNFKLVGAYLRPIFYCISSKAHELCSEPKILIVWHSGAPGFCCCNLAKSGLGAGEPSSKIGSWPAQSERLPGFD